VFYVLDVVSFVSRRFELELDTLIDEFMISDVMSYTFSFLNMA
jgi:hypothetical protein